MLEGNRTFGRRCRGVNYHTLNRDVVEGRFLAWGIDYEELTDGTGIFSVALIEDDGGKVVMCPATSVQFINDRFEREDEEKPEKAGAWIIERGFFDGEVSCSNCGYTYPRCSDEDIDQITKQKECPRCGAEMKCSTLKSAN